jgi:hypothetical protein
MPSIILTILLQIQCTIELSNLIHDKGLQKQPMAHLKTKHDYIELSYSIQLYIVFEAKSLI